MTLRTIHRLALVSVLTTLATVFTVSLLPASASACGPYGTPTPESQATGAALAEQGQRDHDRVVVSVGAVLVQDDHAMVRLVLQDEDGQHFDRTMRLARIDGAWSVTRVGKARPRRVA